MTVETPEKARYRKRYRLDVARGIDRSPVPAGPVRAHIAALTAAGFTLDGIARATRGQVSRAGVGWILTRGGGETVHRANAAALAAVTARSIIAATPPGGFVPKVGTVRRVQALLTLGWRVADIDAAAGTSLRVTLYAAGRALVAVDTHRAVADVYDRWWRTRGPSERSRTDAARKGWAPPLAWDEDTIDDPHARPVGLVGAMQTHRDRLIEDVTALLEDGVTAHSACARLGKSRQALARSLQRAGRHDLWARLNGRTPDATDGTDSTEATA